MKIELLYFAGCPTYLGAESLIAEVLQAHGVPAEIELREIKTAEDALQLRFLGSPTIRVEGVDIDPGARSSNEFGLRCRVYRDGSRFVGVPPRELMERALKEAAHGQEDCCTANG